MRSGSSYKVLIGKTNDSRQQEPFLQSKSKTKVGETLEPKTNVMRHQENQEMKDSELRKFKKISSRDLDGSMWRPLKILERCGAKSRAVSTPRHGGRLDNGTNH